jgi:hypothetical protein
MAVFPTFVSGYMAEDGTFHKDRWHAEWHQSRLDFSKAAGDEVSLRFFCLVDGMTDDALDLAIDVIKGAIVKRDQDAKI